MEAIQGPRNERPLTLQFTLHRYQRNGSDSLQSLTSSRSQFHPHSLEMIMPEDSHHQACVLQAGEVCIITDRPMTTRLEQFMTTGTSNLNLHLRLHHLSTATNLIHIPIGKILMHTHHHPLLNTEGRLILLRIPRLPQLLLTTHPDRYMMIILLPLVILPGLLSLLASHPSADLLLHQSRINANVEIADLSRQIEGRGDYHQGSQTVLVQ